MTSREEQFREFDTRIATILRDAGTQSPNTVALEVRQVALGLGWRPMPDGTIDDANPLRPPLNVTAPTAAWRTARAALANRQETER